MKKKKREENWTEKEEKRSFTIEENAPAVWKQLKKSSGRKSQHDVSILLAFSYILPQAAAREVNSSSDSLPIIW